MKEKFEQFWHYWVLGHCQSWDYPVVLEPFGGYIQQKSKLMCSCGKEWEE